MQWQQSTSSTSAGDVDQNELTNFRCHMSTMTTNNLLQAEAQKLTDSNKWVWLRNASAYQPLCTHSNCSNLLMTKNKTNSADPLLLTGL